MALKLSTRKRPRREDKQLKEATKISEKVFDDRTLLTLKELLRKDVITTLDYPIAQGKESVVFRSTRGSEHRIVKVFKYETSSFRHMRKYVEGDTRFKKIGKKRDLVNLWAKKEHANLKLCEENGISAPKPIACRENVVVMEFLGEGGLPSALLKDVILGDAAETLELILENTRKAYAAGLVHADLSEFNVVIHGGKPFLIDWGQAVLLSHPLAEEFLLKDLANILKYFRKMGVEKEEKEALEYVKGGQ